MSDADTPTDVGTEASRGDDDVIMECEGLKQYFPVGDSLFGQLLGGEKRYVRAVDSASPVCS